MRSRYVFAVLASWVCGVSPGLFGQTFFNGQNATGVIGQTNFTNLGGSNLANRLSDPSGVAYDPVSGKIYIADRLNHRVLRYASVASAQSGAFPECVFGQGTFVGNAANQGLGAPTQKTLNLPRGVAVDTLGRLWVADTGNNRVLRFDNAANLGVNPDASVVLGQAIFTTNASGLSATTLKSPFGLVVSDSDQLWVSDRSNNRVLRFDGVTSKGNGAPADLVLGQVNFTVEGTGISAALLNGPKFLALDPGGTLWISEISNHRVKRHDNAAAIAVNGAPGDGVLGQADFTSGTLNAGSGVTGPIGFVQPLGVYADTKGALWVSDVGNGRVLRFSNAATLPDGAPADLVLGKPDFVTTTVVAAVNRIGGPSGVSGGPDGGILAGDFILQRVLRFDPINVAPTITLIGAKSRSTRQSRLVIRGTAADSDGSITSMRGTLNNKPALVSGTISWSLNARLRQGRNTVKIQSIDNLGLPSGLVTVTVTRR